ncbi:fimbria/pilus outer membrane usher protein [Pseudomonas syringae pv. actinidiae]|nr:fimbria/pilus outer membrane usher protein [Pseudomonas syringae]EPN63949.1 fimbrial usher protein [Pseudomonas syringae pv. actinidiae ICMP 19079]EPN71806.1 fimbrial usher protein [Pseudomonas syringae pv. actinidiae ICMP 19101]AKT30731.1 fimbrial protein [Pseudomonas syringae pv. actinidiae ICMP 18884]AOE57151.1 fimbrial protein [Pseudomonas syringae pv. actinidiae ICMP 18708]APP98109.1 fimbrial protein [Pseudomonas syringae pv. actinidiae]
MDSDGPFAVFACFRLAGARIWLLLGLCAGMHSIESYAAESATTDDYRFDDSLLPGGIPGMGSLSRFNRVDAIDPGQYQVELFMNQRFVDRLAIDFISQPDGGVKACLPKALLTRLEVLDSAIRMPASTACDTLENAVEGASSTFDPAKLRLDLSVPQTLTRQRPRGFVATESLDPGTAIGFVNYSASQYHASYTGAYANHTDSTYVALNGGINLGLWRLRQQSQVRYDSLQGGRWDITRTYLQRALPGLDSELSAGQGFTAGRLFSSMNYLGVEVASDPRMRPDSLRSYAPIVRGIAKTHAKVVIRQNNSELYQTTVAPGPFEISDLTTSGYSGDLQVTVNEADGSVSRFSVPYSALPESLRTNDSRYSVALGKTRDSNAPFSEMTYQRGLSNSITANSGLRVAQGYQALALGGVYANWMGAFGMDSTFSNAQLPGEDTQQGWMLRLSYSRTFEQTRTSFAVSGYRYSTQGYRDLNDVLGLRVAAEQGQTWRSSSYLQRSRMEVSINQSLGSWGNLFVSGSTQDYRAERERDTQLQMGYSKSFSSGLSLSLSVGRQRVGSSRQERQDAYADPAGRLSQANNTTLNIGGTTQTFSQLSVSFPLGSSAKTSTPFLSTSISHSPQATLSQASLSGAVGDDRPLSYSVDTSLDSETRTTTLGTSVQQQTAYASIGGSASRGEGYWQMSANARGAAALHSGGLTLGPYLGDSFALVEAKGASGARLMNAQGAAIDGNGYALLPSLLPYRYNNIALSADGMNDKAELEDGQRRIAPYAGATVKVTFKTRHGDALLIRAHVPNGEQVPLGADVLDAQDKVIGMVGQGGQAYVRSESRAGRLTLRWGDGLNERCTLDYAVDPQAASQPLIQLESECRLPVKQ